MKIVTKDKGIKPWGEVEGILNVTPEKYGWMHLKIDTKDSQYIVVLTNRDQIVLRKMFLEEIKHKFTIVFTEFLKKIKEID